jgi:hypothetical protein
MPTRAIRTRLGLLVALGAGLVSAGLAAERGAEPPRAAVDTAVPASSGRTVAVPAGGSLQAALERAQPGDTITLEPGAIYVGPITLPRKSDEQWITVRTSEPDGSFPAPGRRVDPSHARLMPKVVAASGPALSAAPGAHHYRFIGIEIRPRDGSFVTNLVDFGRGVTAAGDLPHHIVFDRCYLHGDAKKGARRGIALNAREAAVVDSYLADFKEAGADSQAIAGWSGPGPFKIVNNYLEAAGENLLFGGADPPIRDLVPADIEIRRNHFAKPLAWKSGERGYEGTTWTVKNLLELKNARRVLIEGNLLEHNWVQAQNGFAILFTVRNQDGGAPWSTIEDVTFVNNVLRHSAAGINMLGRDDNHPSQAARRIVIRNNLFEDIGGPRWGGGGTLFQLLNGVGHVVIEHNTAAQSGTLIMAEGPTPHEGFVFRANIAPHNLYGIIGAGTGPGSPTIERFFPGGVVEQNVIAGAGSARYPRDNFFPGSLDGVGFVDRGRGDYRLGEGSRYRRAAGGQDPGADVTVLDAARTAAAPPAAR